MRQFLPIGFFLCLLFLLPACEQVSSVTAGLSRLLPDWIPGVENKKVKKIKKPSKKKTAPAIALEPDAVANPTAPVEAYGQPETSVQPDVEPSVMNQPGAEAPIPSAAPATTNIVFKPSLKFSATQVTQTKEKKISPKIIDDTIPFKVGAHWGGAAEILAEVSPKSAYEFVGQGRRVTVFQSTTLVPLSSADASADILAIVSFANKGKQVVYVQEAGAQLEVFDLNTQGQLTKRNSFGMENDFDGPFEFPSHEGEDSHQIFVRHPDKIQCLEVNRPEVELVGDYPTPQSLQVLPKKDRLYILHAGGLNIMDRDSKQSLASLALVGEVKLLGLVDLAGTYTLVSLLKNPSSKYWEYVLPIELSWDGRSVQKVGEPIALPPNVEQVSLDELKPSLFLGKGQVVQIFDLITKTALIPETPVAGAIKALRGAEPGLRVLQQDKLSTYAWKSAGPLSEASSAPLLTQVNKFVSLPNQATLFFSDKMLAYGDGSKIIFKPLPGTQPINISTLAISNQGVFFFETNRAKTFYATFDLSVLNELDVTEKVDSLASLSRAGKTFLLAVGTKGLTSFEVTQFKTTKKLGALPATDFSDLALSYTGTKIYVACGARGLCVLDNQEQSKFKVAATIPPTKTGAKAQAVILSPNQQVAYLYNTLAQGNYLSVIEFKKEKSIEVSTLSAKDITSQQLKGATFSRGGQTLILPDAQGLSFNNLKKPAKPTTLFRLDLGPAEFADVANQGKTICVALGSHGMECGELVPAK